MGDSCVGTIDVSMDDFVRGWLACLKRPLRAHFSWARVFGANTDVGILGTTCERLYLGQFLPDGNK